VYPGPISFFGSMWATWNLLFLLGVIVGFGVLRATFRAVDSLQTTKTLALRYLICVYVCALGAQWFAYAVDANTTLLPPPGFNAWRYYFHPLAGPKTLYGAVLVLPFAALAFVPGTSVRWESIVDRSTPALFTILGFARLGCFLQGCCYGLRTDDFGLSFPVGSSVHADQYAAGLVAIDHSSLPVLPVQLASVVACFGLSLWFARKVRNNCSHVFVRTVAAYSVFRFIVEFARADAARNHMWVLSTSQWVAVAILLTVAAHRLRTNGVSPSGSPSLE
jgi:phosphatidylglycerol---prolipoprotein diacylglyceryl transferase